MGTISDKLTYLNTTKTMLRDSLNKYGSNILTTDTFRSYDTKLNDIYDKLPKITQSGAGFTLENVQNGQVDDFKMIGTDLEQNGTPSPDNPQEIKVVENRQVITDKGKNLFDKDNEIVGCVYNSSGTLVSSVNWNTNNEFKQVNENKVSVSCKTTNSINCLLIEFDSNKNFIQRQQSTTTSYTFTLNNNTKYLRFCYLNNVGTYDIQIEESSTATDYEPYYNPVSYNIDLHGKNCFDGQYEDGYYGNYNNSNGTKNPYQDPYGCRSTNKNEVKPNQDYIISINNVVTNLNIRLFYYDINRNYLSTNTTTNGIFTTPKNCYYITWHSSLLKQNYPNGIPNMMIENNNQVTSYEDYYDYKLAKIPNTDYKNRIYKSNGNWYYEKNVEKVILDGSEEWGYGSISGVFYTTSITNYAISNNVPYSNYYTGVSNVSGASNMGQQSNNTIGFINVSGQTTARFYIKDTRYTNNTQDLKAWLSTHNLELWYILATPVTTQITNTTLISQLEAISVHTGTNIIELSSDNNMTPEIEITRLKELERLT